MTGAPASRQEQHTSSAKPAGRLSSIRARVRRLPGGFLAWRIGVTVLGVAIIVGGIILLPLPGPGWVIIFAGLGLLATEYAWARRLLTFARDTVKQWTGWIGRQPLWVRAVLGLLTVAAVAAIIWVAWRVYR